MHGRFNKYYNYFTQCVFYCVFHKHRPWSPSVYVKVQLHLLLSKTKSTDSLDMLSPRKLKNDDYHFSWASLHMFNVSLPDDIKCKWWLYSSLFDVFSEKLFRESFHISVQIIWHLTINVFVVNYLQPQDSIIEVDFSQLVVIGLLLKLNAHVTCISFSF